MYHYILEAAILVVCIVNVILDHRKHDQTQKLPRNPYGPIK